jgi:hypothetical protein
MTLSLTDTFSPSGCILLDNVGDRIGRPGSLGRWHLRGHGAFTTASATNQKGIGEQCDSNKYVECFHLTFPVI